MRVTFSRFEECTWDRFIDVRGNGRRVTLCPSLLLTNEMGVRAGIEEEITPDKWAKVVFHLPQGKAKGACLLWFVGWLTKPDPQLMTLRVNGRRLTHRMDLKKMLAGGWDRHAIPAGRLRPGRNEVVFADHGKLQVDPGKGGASFRSFDRGHAWHADALGPGHDLSGQYMVRLRVKGPPAAGVITSRVIDLGDPDDRGRIAPRMEVRRVRLAAQAQTPADTGVVIEMRSGSTPMFDPTCWTPWQATRTLREAGRFVQWRATLTTRRMEASPVLTGVNLEAEVDTVPDGRVACRVIEWERPVLKRSSYAFTYLAPHPRAERLVKQYRLDEVVAPGRTDFERLGLLRQWVHRQWYGWQRDDYPFCPSWDPIEILDTVKNNWGYGMCTHYAATFVGCAAALGYAARSLIVDHHCLAEVWIGEWARWVCMDPGPDRKFSAVYELDGVPANALEIHEAIRQGRGKDLRERRFPQNRVRPMRKQIENTFCRFGIPLRNNHLVQPEPAELAHGDDQYHWDGYLWWSDDADPKYPEYSLQTRRAADMYWTVGQVRIHLQRGARPGRLRVDLEHAMPSFEQYLARFNSGTWESAAAGFEWELGPGENVLEVRAQNAFGRQGPRARVTLRHGRP